MKIRGLIILLTAIVLSACSNRAANIKQYYRLNPDTTVTQTKTNPDDRREAVLISRPTTLGILGGRPMVATQSDGALVQLNNHYWLESPTVLLHRILIEWADNHWQQIKTQAAYNAAIDRLDTTLLAFEKDGQQAKVSLQFVLRNNDGDILLNKTWQQNQTIEGDNYAGFVAAINQAVGLILNKLNQTIDKQ